MINKLGKALVLVHVAVCVLAMTWSASIFLQFVDWGWKEPRKVLDQRVPSEIDKRAAALKEAVRVREQLAPAAPLAQAALAEAEKRFPANHLWYLAELDRLANAPDVIDIKEVKYTPAGMVEVQPLILGTPVFENKLPVDKSYKTYKEEGKKVQQEIDQATQETQMWVKKITEITLRLNDGKDDAGKVVKTGLYTLLETEKKLQDRAREERESMLPVWVRTLEEADLYQIRRTRLESTLDKLQKAGGTVIKK